MIVSEFIKWIQVVPDGAQEENWLLKEKINWNLDEMPWIKAGNGSYLWNDRDSLAELCERNGRGINAVNQNPSWFRNG